jgi:hypothetical protein
MTTKETLLYIKKLTGEDWSKQRLYDRAVNCVFGRKLFKHWCFDVEKLTAVLTGADSCRKGRPPILRIKDK